MKVGIILERVNAELGILTEMPEKDLKVVINALEKEFKKYGLRIHLTKHFINYALHSAAEERKTVSAADLYRTIMEFLNKHGTRFDEFRKSRKNFKIAITNKRTNLTINLVIDYNKPPRDSNVPYDAALQSIIKKDDYRADNNPVDFWSKVNV